MIFAIAQLEPAGRFRHGREIALGDLGIDRIAHVLFANLGRGLTERIPDLVGEFAGLDALGLQTGQSGTVFSQRQRQVVGIDRTAGGIDDLLLRVGVRSFQTSRFIEKVSAEPGSWNPEV